MTTNLWPDEIDEIFGGDQAILLASVTPAGGVVLTPVTNFALRDRQKGTLTVNSSVGAWKKLERMRRNPQVALGFHTRRHGFSDRPEYVLVQGRARVGEPIPDYPATIGEKWERFDGPRGTGPVWDRWLSVYYTRVEIVIEVERLVVWPDLACLGAPTVHGTALPDASPRPQDPPKLGSGPRIDHVRAARRAARLRDVLLGWAGADGLPMVVPVKIDGTDGAGIRLVPPPETVPVGGRRAGLTAHSFTRYVMGQRQRVQTGWLAVEEGSGQVRYAPHSERGYRMPPSKLVYRLAVGAAMRAGAQRHPASVVGGASQGV